ncbi:MAG: serine/threonine protein kinase [Thermoprotei archaeon]|nr:MAG: serine/threonine protein kinase [Thermoprotei archaeon]
MTMRLVLEALRKLRNREFRVLNAVERGMARFFYVPLEEIARLSELSLEEVTLVTKRLNALGLLQRNVGSYVGYILTSRGYDCLALNALRRRGVVEKIGASPIGVGKESDVYPGLTPTGKLVAVKFHRVGRVSFRHTRRVRVYIGDRRHISWLYQSRLAAKSEFEALRLLFTARVSVPRPIDWNRHIVVTDYVEGIELFKAPPLSKVQEFKDRVVEEVKKAYRAGVVHGDLSEYNVLVVKSEIPVLFDWPQWVSSSHPMALHYLKRDLENLLRFFRRKYNLKISVGEEVSRVIAALSGR